MPSATEQLDFLKQLQKELNEQDHDSQAEPRFWVIADYRYVRCDSECYDRKEIRLPQTDETFENFDEFSDYVKQDLLDNLPSDATSEFNDLCNMDTAIEWLQEYVDQDAELIYAKKNFFICPNTMFLTKSEAKQHLKSNTHNYSDKAHTYAMTAYRAPVIERLIKLLETFDWESINMRPDQNNFETWKQALTLDDMAKKWASSSDCETCPLRNDDVFCNDYESKDDCTASLIHWGKSQTTDNTSGIQLRNNEPITDQTFIKEILDRIKNHAVDSVYVNKDDEIITCDYNIHMEMLNTFENLGLTHCVCSDSEVIDGTTYYGIHFI